MKALETMTELKKVLYVALIILCFLPKTLFAQETEKAFHERMQWWDEGRVGMFIHWGIYSTFGGEYNGTDYGKEAGQNSAEWIYLTSSMPEADYRKAALNWNPDEYNAEEWVKMAKNAGMTYMVLTAKHHDGLALFDSKHTEWNAAKSTGAKRDLVQEFVTACRKYDMKVGFYYSHEKDWMHHTRLNRNTGTMPKSYAKFAEKQITELLTKYGKIDLIWYDTPIDQHLEFNKMCGALIRKYQPECIINGRIGNDIGDYKNIGDRAIVDPGMTGYMESIMTMRLNWGYDKNDDAWKSSKDLINMVSKSACRGSNFLLNIGPKPEGSFPMQDQVRLRDLGEWMKTNGEAIYKTKGSPFPKEHTWGSLTLSKEENVIYLHLINWTGGDIEVKGIKSKVNSASFLDANNPLSYVQDENSPVLTIQLPEFNTDKFARIIKLNLDGKELDITKGPNFVADKIASVEYKKITGSITKINGVDFSFHGKKVIFQRMEGTEVYSKEAETMELTLNDHVKFRINNKGNITQVQEMDFKEGAEYHIVYSVERGHDHPEVEIITRLE